tara:strand:- start:1997 stop:2221 length:225 start_codon:yes stop_codon:yes gene_type:complete
LCFSEYFLNSREKLALAQLAAKATQVGVLKVDECLENTLKTVDGVRMRLVVLGVDSFVRCGYPSGANLGRINIL